MLAFFTFLTLASLVSICLILRPETTHVVLFQFYIRINRINGTCKQWTLSYLWRVKVTIILLCSCDQSVSAIGDHHFYSVSLLFTSQYSSRAQQDNGYFHSNSSRDRKVSTACMYRLFYLSECKIGTKQHGWSLVEGCRDEAGKSKMRQRKKGQHGGPLVKTRVMASPVVWKRPR